MKLTLLLVFTLINTTIFSQNIRVDIFDDLEYESRKNDYKAFFKKDIFDGLEFTDNHKNKLSFNKKYIIANYPLIYQNEKHKISFFKSLIHHYKHEYNLEVTHEIDIFDHEIISDNRNNKTKESYDIFDNKTIERSVNGSKYSIKKSINGNIEYHQNNSNFMATLKKGFRDEWVYEDSTDNEFTFSKKTWNKLIDKFGTSEAIFNYLLDEFIYINKLVY